MKTNRLSSICFGCEFEHEQFVILSNMFSLAVLEWNEAPMHRHNRERHSFHQSGVPLPAPKLDRTPAKPTDFSQVSLGMHTESVLSELGYGTEELERFVTEKVVFQKRKSGL